mgnify:CR=1 FL=1
MKMNRMKQINRGIVASVLALSLALTPIVTHAAVDQDCIDACDEEASDCITNIGIIYAFAAAGCVTLTLWYVAPCLYAAGLARDQALDECNDDLEDCLDDCLNEGG